VRNYRSAKLGVVKKLSTNSQFLSGFSIDCYDVAV
jgi:hypothetical protein